MRTLSLKMGEKQRLSRVGMHVEMTGFLVQRSQLDGCLLQNSGGLPGVYLE